MLDSWARAGPSLLEEWFVMAGNYRQCRDVRGPQGSSIKGNYCVLMIQPQWTGSIVQFGTCMPDSCSPSQITDIVRESVRHREVTSLTVLGVECRDDQRDYSLTFILSVVVLGLFVSMSILGTACDMFNLNFHRHVAKDSDTVQKKGDNTTLNVIMPNVFEDKMVPVLLAFSIRSNLAKVLDTRAPKGSITCINGIRVLSMAWVVLWHLVWRSCQFGLNSKDGIAELENRRAYNLVFNGFFWVVDTFFTLSGFLVAYTCSKDILIKGKKFSLKMFYFHRLWRIWPPYMLYFLFVVGLASFMGSGALWSNSHPVEIKQCEENWWTNVLFINSLVKTEDMCFSHSWYLSADMQFYIISPLLVLPLCYFKMKGAAVCLVVQGLNWLLVFVLSLSNNWPLAQWQDKEQYSHKRTHHYFAPYSRISPFIVGILAGYLLATCGDKMKLKKRAVILGWTLATCTFLGLLFGVHGDVTGTSRSSAGVAALYHAFGSTAWGLAICWVMWACFSGNGGPVNDFLSWKPFTVLSRISYGVYLIHYDLLTVFIQNLERPFFITEGSLLFFFISAMVICTICALCLAVVVEMPLLALEKAIISRMQPKGKLH